VTGAPAIRGPEDFQSLTGVSRETLDRFGVWARLLTEWSDHTNLVSRSTLPDFWSRHALDSWQVLDAVARLRPDQLVPSRWLDIGAGAGFPGLALAFTLADRDLPDAQVILVESVAKKARFLEAVIAETGAPARVLNQRAEALDPGLAVDAVTARAVAPLDTLLRYAHPFVEKGAVAVFPKGRRYVEELTEARKGWRLDPVVAPSLTDPDAALILLERYARGR
jgi:16S rRNA (guanine527-N7)-methyltransferase